MVCVLFSLNRERQEAQEEAISAEEIEKLAADVVTAEGDDDGEDDDDDDDDDDIDDELEPEPDFEDRDPCEVLLKVHSKILGEFLKAALNHLIGQDFSKSRLRCMNQTSHTRKAYTYLNAQLLGVFLQRRLTQLRPSLAIQGCHNVLSDKCSG